MKLSPKAVRFVIEALDHYRQYHDERLKREGLSEDEISGLLNDRQYLEAIQREFEKYRDDLLQDRQEVSADD